MSTEHCCTSLQLNDAFTRYLRAHAKRSERELGRHDTSVVPGRDTPSFPVAVLRRFRSLVTRELLQRRWDYAPVLIQQLDARRGYDPLELFVRNTGLLDPGDESVELRL